MPIITLCVSSLLKNKKQLIPSLSVQSIRLYHDQVKLNLCENSCFLDL